MNAQKTIEDLIGVKFSSFHISPEGCVYSLQSEVTAEQAAQLDALVDEHIASLRVPQDVPTVEERLAAAELIISMLAEA